MAASIYVRSIGPKAWCAYESVIRIGTQWHAMHLQGSVGRTGLMMGLRSNLSTDMPTKEASASQEASVAAKRVQLVELSYMGQGNELDTLCACRLRVSPIQSVSQSSIHHSLLQECSTHFCASTQAPEQSGSKG